MLTKGIEVMKYVRASAGRAGLQVVFEDTNEPRHDGNTIYLPKITSFTTEEELNQLMASVDHEVAHDKFSSFDVLNEKHLDSKSLVMFMWNFLEDSRINTIEANEYRGFKENWDNCSSVIVDKIYKNHYKGPNFISELITTLIYWESKINCSLFPKIELIASKHKTPKKEILDVLNSYSSDLIYCHGILDKTLGTTETFNLAKEILKDIVKNLEDDLEEYEKTTEEKKSESKSGGERKVTSKEVEKTGESSTGKTTEESKVKEEKEEDEFKIIKIKLNKEDIEKFSLTIDKTQEMGKIGVNFDPVDLKSDEWDLTDYDKFIVIDYPKNKGDPEYLKSDINTKKFLDYYEERVETKLISQENFAQQVRKLIQIRAKVQTQYGVEKGKLDQSRLSRICFNDSSRNNGFSKRIFKNRIENKTLDACISVLVDMSGSMGGDKAFYALASALLMNEVCSTLNIPLEIVGFSDNFHPISRNIQPSMFIYKSFSDFKVPSNDLKESFAKSSKFMNGNPDGENILWSYDRIVNRKEKKKLFIVMSDGSPAASKYCSGLEGFTLKVIREIEKTKKVNIFGLGLSSDSVKYYYSKNDVVYSPENIPSTLLSLIEKGIIK